MAQKQRKEKQIPPHILLALQVAEESGDPSLKKLLPAYANGLVQQGQEVTRELLLDHVQQGLVVAGKGRMGLKSQKQDKGYEKIVANLLQTEQEKKDLENPVLRFRHYASLGDIEAVEKIIRDYGGVKIKGWGDDNISYRKLIEPACRYGHLDMLKYAVEKGRESDPEIGNFWLESEAGQALERNDWEIIRYLRDDLGLDLQSRYVESPYIMYVEKALENGHFDIVKYIFPDIFESKFKDHPSLFSACFLALINHGDLNLVKEFHAINPSYRFDKHFGHAEIKDEAMARFLFLEADCFNLEAKKYALIHNFSLQLSIDGKKILAQSVQREEKNFFAKFSTTHELWEKLTFFPGKDHASRRLEAAELLNWPHFLRDKEVKRLTEFRNEWQRLCGYVPFGKIAEFNPAGLSKKCFEDVSEMLVKEGMDESIAQRYAYQTARLFRSTDRVLAYLDKWGQATRQPLHDIIHDINLPDRTDLDFSAWADAVLQHGPAMARLTPFADRIKEPLRSDDGKVYSLNKTREAVSQFAYKRAKDHKVLSSLCYAFKITEHDFNRGLKIAKKFKKDQRSKIPDITIEGDQFGKPGYKFSKLPDGDVRGLLLGQYTDCCQHIASAGASCAEHGFLSDNGGFYIVEDGEGQIIGQSWAWIGKNNELVFDSLENLKGRLNKENWNDICEHVADYLNASDNNCVTRFHVGQGGATPALDFAIASQSASPSDYSGYRDSKTQYQVWSRRKSPKMGA